MNNTTSNTIHRITARNSDNQWEWDGSAFIKTSGGDFNANPEAWDEALASFRTEFNHASKAKLILEKITFGEDDEAEAEVEELISVSA